MTPEQQERVKEIYAEAMDMDPSLRDGFLATASAGDDEVLGELRSLLRHDTARTVLKNAFVVSRTPDVNPSPDAADDESPSESRVELSPALEAEYADYYFRQSLPRLRRAMWLAILLYGGFGVLDAWVAPEQRWSLWLIRAVVIAGAAGALVWSHAPGFQRWWQLSITVLIAIGAFGIIGMVVLIPPPGSHQYYAGLLLLTIYYCTLVRLNFWYAAALSFIIFTTYVGVALAIETPGTVLFTNIMMLAAGNVIGLTGNFAIGQASRRDFSQRRALARQNAQLTKTNAELVQSKAEIARSAERNELLFAALTEALPGTVLDGKYRLDQKIGSGGFGTVYRGFHLQLERTVAVKLLKPAGGDLIANLARFRREAIAACRLTHPNAVHVFDFGVSSGVGYLVMELLEGRSLAQELETCGRLTLARCAAIVRPMCALLAEAHRTGLIHRDLKPNNVFLHVAGEQETVKIIDFGVAKVIGVSGPDMQSINVSSVIGTPAYMAPERLMGADGDASADIYAVGVVIYEMLTGEKPFATPAALNPAGGFHQLTQRAVPTCVRHPEIPPPVGAIIDRTLDRDPRHRPTAEELGAAFAVV